MDREVTIKQSKRGHSRGKHYCNLTSALFSISHLLSIFMAKTLSAFFSFTTATWKGEMKNKLQHGNADCFHFYVTLQFWGFLPECSGHIFTIHTILHHPERNTTMVQENSKSTVSFRSVSHFPMYNFF